MRKPRLVVEIARLGGRNLHIEPGQVGARTALNLDDVGTEVTKRLGGDCSNQRPGEIEHLHSGQRSWPRSSMDGGSSGGFSLADYGKPFRQARGSGKEAARFKMKIFKHVSGLVDDAGVNPAAQAFIRDRRLSSRSKERGDGTFPFGASLSRQR